MRTSASEPEPVHFPGAGAGAGATDQRGGGLEIRGVAEKF